MRGKLTSKEQQEQIAALAEAGYKNREIAERTGINMHTVVRYAKNAEKRQQEKENYTNMPENLIKEWEALHWKYGMKKTWQQWDEATKNVRRALWQRKRRKLSV